MQLTHSLKAPGFNHRTYRARNRFQAFAFKCNLYRYNKADLKQFKKIAREEAKLKRKEEEQREWEAGLRTVN